MTIRTSLSDEVGTMLAVSCEDRVDYDSLRALPAFRHQRAFLDQLLDDDGDDAMFSLDGFCVPCGRPSTFRLNRRPLFAAETSGPNWREGLHCEGCGMNNRIRSMAWITERVAGERERPQIYATERRTAFYDWLATRYGEGVVGSEYLDPTVEPGRVVDGIRHEDVERLSFDDAKFDVVVSMDVLEHVNDPARAIEQIARVLKPEGELLLSVPFFAGSPSNIRRSQILDGEVVHHLPPEYHGASPPGQGWLVFWDFGWELVDEFRARFASVELVVYWSRQYVHLGPNLYFFRCVRGTS
jgi:SAM-dependent methyltransferase